MLWRLGYIHVKDFLPSNIIYRVASPNPLNQDVFMGSDLLFVVVIVDFRN